MEIRKIMERIYDKEGMVKRNPNLIKGQKSNTSFLKDEFILWGAKNGLGIKGTIKGAEPDLVFNWEKITEVRALPEL